MSYPIRVLAHVLVVVLACCSISAAAPPASSATKSPTANIDSYVKADGESYFAVNLWPSVAQPPVSPRLLAVVFDTSASQTGSFREQGLAALETLLAEQTPNDRVALLAADLQTTALTPGFVPASSQEMQKALTQLRQRVPLGATDMGAAITAVADLLTATDANGRVRRVAYIGDGVSTAKLISPARMRKLADRCAELRMSVSCYAVGPRIDLPLLGALAKHTGGLIVLDAEKSAASLPGAELAEAVRGAVIWPETIELPAGLHSAYYRGVPPLRFDRDTVVLGARDAAQRQANKPETIRMAGQLAGKPVELNWRATESDPSDDNAYLAELVNLAEQDGGASLPTVGSAGLAELRKLVHHRARSLSVLSQQALALGQLSQAEWLADQAAKIDPSEPETAIVKTALRKARAEAAGERPRELKLASRKAAVQAPDGEAAKGDDPDESAGGALLDEVERQQRVYRQFLQTEVRNVVNMARQTMAVDPENAIDMLKLVLEKVTQAPEVDPELRDRLKDQIETALRAASQQSLVMSERELVRQQNLAESDARRRITRELFLQEQKVDQLIARFNALMDEERYRDAEAIASIAEEMSPNTPGLRDAELTARMIGYTADMRAVADARHKGVIDLLYQVELSLVPTPDEPPILYPDPEVWQLLTERRKKYKAVDLTESNPTEAKIVAALDDKTELEFVDQPLQDVVDYLKERHEIEIQLDSKALTDEGIGTDTPVTRNIKGITLRSALRLMLGELDLTYVIRNEVLMITTKTEAENMLSTKVYPVADLVVPIGTRLGGGGMGGMGGMGMGGMGMGGRGFF